ncbi:hypothetical protein [Succinimonas sp.]|uniref:hypothetical protein n=1 Tax=Succinimonas sp. TaxID=1936151 RepID=UPI0038645FB6
MKLQQRGRSRESRRVPLFRTKTSSASLTLHGRQDLAETRRSFHVINALQNILSGAGCLKKLGTHHRFVIKPGIPESKNIHFSISDFLTEAA